WGRLIRHHWGWLHRTIWRTLPMVSQNTGSRHLGSRMRIDSTQDDLSRADAVEPADRHRHVVRRPTTGCPRTMLLPARVHRGSRAVPYDRSRAAHGRAGLESHDHVAGVRLAVRRAPP